MDITQAMSPALFFPLALAGPPHVRFFIGLVSFSSCPCCFISYSSYVVSSEPYKDPSLNAVVPINCMTSASLDLRAPILETARVQIVAPTADEIETARARINAGVSNAVIELIKQKNAEAHKLLNHQKRFGVQLGETVRPIPEAFNTTILNFILRRKSST